MRRLNFNWQLIKKPRALKWCPEWRRRSERRRNLQMDLEITAGPSHPALHQGNSVLITERDGQISWPSDKGLYLSTPV